MGRIITVPDGKGGYIELYSMPLNTRDANAWLKRVGATHLKFATSGKKAVLKDVNSNKVYLSAYSIRELCCFLAFQPLQMKKYGIAGYDWYRPDEAWNNIIVDIHS